MADIGKFTRNPDGTITHEYTRWRTVLIDKAWQETQLDIDEIENLPEVKSQADQETLEYWNQMAEQEKKRKDDIIERLKWKRDWSLVMEQQGVLTNEEIENLRQLEQTIEKYQ